ncbi:DsrE family protein [Chloroherpeton thalassium ATCC 35110]|uniref:DsrE family protein n=1 Tax=Chloroherpeton thalassium (strain ATCC 35110 / GB-78) TaxID=517418 RepID=B3QSW9_CHLT3|nr:DsrE family protein [Chloroherpeton thalassium]ACF12612.1 DsrE family protein [Chloroherpeton thalassium ATCC 35110]
MVDEGSVVIFVTSGTQTPQRCGTPFYMASISASMDHEVTMIFQIDGVLLMKKGQTDNIAAKEGGKKIIDFIREAKEAGVKMHVCAAAMQLHDMKESDLIEECDGLIGASFMTEMAMDSDLTLIY